MSSGSMMSNVGNKQIYEDGDQRTSKEGSDKPPRFEAGQENAHNLLDSKDNRSLGNNLAAAEKAEREEEEAEANRGVSDPLKAATDHGNEPSRGAKIDAEIMEDEKKYLEQKDAN